MRKLLFLVACLSLSISAFAGKPKLGPGFLPGINEGEGNDGNTTGSGSNTEVTLPVGFPVAGDEIANTESNATSNIVYTFDLSDANGAASANQTHAALERAKDMNAACVLIRIDGFAGGWDVAQNIRQEIIQYDRPVMVYVNNQAVPAASFISSGADSIYTKKGTTISNRKGISTKPKVAKPKKVKTIAAAPTVSNTPAQPNAQSSQDATMNEILYKAGLSNLTVVEHEATFSERALDFLINPFVLIAVLLLIGFVMRKTAKSRLPGPMLYGLAICVLLYLAPFQLSGLANGVEIVASLALIASVIASTRYNKRWLTGICLLALTFMFALVRAGDTDALLRFGTFSELLSLPSLPLGLVVLGWWIGKIGENRKANTADSRESIPAELAAAA